MVMINGLDPSDDGFDVFISYSRTDIRLARVLHAALERYQVPLHVPRRRRRLSVFRDETDIRGTRYYDAIEAHLRSSRKLLLICSPAARRSAFVDDEIRRFIDANSLSNVIPVIACGRPNNEASSEELKAFPDLLGDLPLAADLSAFEPRRHRLQDRDWGPSWHLILSNILDVERDAFEGEVNARDELARAEAVRLAEIANARRAQGRPAEALLHMAAAHAILPDSQLKTNLGIATTALFPRLAIDRIVPLAESLRGLRFNADHSRVATWSPDGQARLLDAASGEVLAMCTHSDVIWDATFLRDGSVATYSRDGRITIMAASGDSVAWDAPFMALRVIEAPAGDLLALVGVNGEICLRSRRGAAPIGTIENFVGGDRPWAMFSPDGEILHATDGSTLIQVDRTAQGRLIPLPAKLVVHQTVDQFGSFLVSDAGSILLLHSSHESGEAGLLTVAARTPGVAVASLSPNLKRLCWIDDGDMLYSREWFLYVGEDDPHATEDDGRVPVPIKPELRNLAFWNGHAVALAYGDRGACAVSVDGTLLWQREFDRRSVLGGGIKVHADVGVISQVDFKQSHVTTLDLADGTLLEERRLVRPVMRVESSGDGAYLASASGEGALRLGSVRRRRADQASRRYYDVAHVVESGDRVLLAFEGQDGSLRVLDAVSGIQAFPLLRTAPGSGVLIVPDRRTALTWGEERPLQVWRAQQSEAEPREIALPSVRRGRSGPVSVSETGHLVAIAEGGTISVVSLDTEAAVLSRMVHADDSSIRRLQLGPAGTYLASASDTMVRLWVATTGASIGDPLRFKAPLIGLGFTTSGRHLVAWSLDNSFAILDANTSEAIWCVHPGPETIMEAGIRAVRMSADGKLIFTAGPDRSMRIWDVATGDEVAEPAVHPFPLGGIAPSDHAERILTWGADMVSVWNPWSGSKVGPDIEVAGLVSGAFWTTDNARVAVLEGSSLSLFDPETSLLIAGPWRHGGQNFAARFVDDMLVTWTEDGLAAVWGVEAGKSVVDWRAASERATSMGLDLDRRVLSPLGVADHAMLDTESTRRALDTVYGNDERPRAVALSGFPSGRPLTEATVRHYLVGEHLFDLRLNPVGQPNPAEPVDGGAASATRRDDVAVQRAEGLMWQVGGSEAVRFENAAEYIRSMNAARYAGFDDWRLPRLHEAAATLSPELTGPLHVIRGLGAQEVIWTSDRLDDTDVWTVHYGIGQVVPAPADSAHAVRLVRSCIDAGQASSSP
jgi:WD40 repeat protein